MHRSHRTVPFVLAIVAFSAVTLGACGSDDTDTSSTTSAPITAVGATAPGPISPEQGAALLAERGDKVTLIDVRTPEEFATGHLENAVNYDIQGTEFASQLDALDPDGLYVVYCRSGNRSGAAVAQMIASGFTQVYDLGGIQDWTAAGFPVVT